MPISQKKNKIFILLLLQDSRHKINPTQAAFTKTTVTNGAFHVPVQTRREVGFASQVKSKRQVVPPRQGLLRFAAKIISRAQYNSVLF